MTAYVIENTQNTKIRRKTAMALAMAAGLTLLPLAGCETIERETGFNRNTQLGAAGGAAINYAFIDHFQVLARGHFTVRRLERIYGPDVVRAEYDAARRETAGNFA